MKNSKMIIVIVSICVFSVGCATGGSHIDGNMRVDHVGQTGLVHKGATMSQFYEKDIDGDWKLVGRALEHNNSIAEQLGGAAAMVGSAHLIGKGISKSGDSNTTNNSNNSSHESGDTSVRTGSTSVQTNDNSVENNTENIEGYANDYYY